MTAHSTVRARGVSQTGSSISQFVAELDSGAQSWRLVTEDGRVYRSEAGVLHLPPDQPRAAEFRDGMPHAVRMLHPDALPLWGRGSESFSPMLAQRVGDHSILLTFEHVADPAFRATLVIDEALGVVRKTAMMGDVTILTEVAIDQPTENRTEYEFAPIDDWIRPDY